MMVCASSMNRMIGLLEPFTSEMTPLSRFSNSPFTLAPAWSRPRSRPMMSVFWSRGGTSFCTIISARPSTSAVLPTPESPTMIGLFFRRRARMSII